MKKKLIKDGMIGRNDGGTGGTGACVNLGEFYSVFVFLNVGWWTLDCGPHKSRLGHNLLLKLIIRYEL